MNFTAIYLKVHAYTLANIVLYNVLLILLYMYVLVQKKGLKKYKVYWTSY